MPVIVYMTASTTEEAAAIGRMLVQRRLAACINILGSIQSIYRWQHTIEEAQEVAFIAKTDAANGNALTDAVCNMQSYETPCIITLPITTGLPNFLAWIQKESQPEQTRSFD